MGAKRDPDFLTIRRGLRLLQQTDPDLFIEPARGLAFALEGGAGRAAPAPRRQAEARRLAQELFALYPFEAAT
jgi:hypothetical protein